MSPLIQMSTTTPTSLYDNINKLYSTSGFMDRYGMDVWITLIICVVFFVVSSYFYIMNQLQPIKINWEQEKCNPRVMPFAGLINPPPGVSAFVFTATNFAQCTNRVLEHVASSAFKPFFYLLYLLNKIFTEATEALGALRNIMAGLRDKIKIIVETIFKIFTNMTLPIMHLYINFKEILEKVVGTLTATLYLFAGSYLGLKSLILFIFNLIIYVLLGIAGSIVALILIGSIPIFGSWAIPITIATQIFMWTAFVITILVKLFMDDVLRASGESVPTVPGCFAGQTPMTLYSGETRALKTIDVGDTLADGGVVTAVIKFAADQQELFEYHDVLVTGEHRVFDAAEGGWLQVKKHPLSKRLTPLAENTFKKEERFVYCLNTTTKVMHAQTQTQTQTQVHAQTQKHVVFSDWDDIDTEVHAALKERCTHKGFLPPNFLMTDLHRCLDAGLAGDTLITLKGGKRAPISTIQVDDVLLDGAKVVGVVHVLAADMEVFLFRFPQGEAILGTQNLQLVNRVGQEVNCMEYYGELVPHTQKYLYHLLTESGVFVANTIKLKHYNSAIDKYVL